MAEERDKYKRPTWNDYFMKIAMLVSERSTCLRHHVGAIIVKDKRILTTGYNGAAVGITDCLTRGCLRDEQKIPSGERQEICRAIHAEQNAIIQAGQLGVNIQGGVMYCTHSSCIICAKMVVNSGIKKFFTYIKYPDTGGVKDLFDEAGVEIIELPRPDTQINILD